MEDEIIACVKKDDLKYLQSGQVSKHIFPMKRKEAHEKEIPHLIVRVFIMRKKESGKIEYLVQKRSERKKAYPGYYTDSASGHILYKECLSLKDIKQNAIRELNEEFGITKNNLESLFFYELTSEKNKITTEVAYIFMGVVKSEVDLKPDPNEVDPSASRFYSKDQLSRILNNEKLVDHSKRIWKKLLENKNLHIFNESDKTKSIKEDNKKISPTALFIGRFQPLHHGHIHIIYRIFEKCDSLKIGIGSSQFADTKTNPFSSEERKQFIKAVMKKREINAKKYEIYEIPDIFNAKKWIDHVLNIVGDFDIVFSNSDWVRELFQNKNYKLANKTTIFRNKYNGSNIRKLIAEEDNEWINLVPNEVVFLIQKYNGIKRIKSLYGDQDEK